jgi:cytochrome P450
MSEATANIPNIPNPWEIPLEKINVLDPVLFENDAHWGFFERLRKEDPVHLNEDDEFGRYWSVTKFNDIMTVDTNHGIYSSDGGITIGPPASQVATGQTMQTPMFIAMDPPKHDMQRATVSPVVQPSNLAKLEIPFELARLASWTHYHVVKPLTGSTLFQLN